MSHSAPTRRDIGWSAAAQILQYGSNIILLPVLLHFLSATSFGVWSAFILVAGFVQLLDFGLQPSLIRNLSFHITHKNPDERDYALVARIEAGRRIYRKLTICVIGTQLTLGTLYLNTLPIPFDLTLVVAWVGFSVGTALSFHASYLIGGLQGLHEVGKAQRAAAMGRVFNMLLTTATVAAGAGLLGTAVGVIAGGCVTWLLARWHLNTHQRKLAAIKARPDDVRISVSEIWNMAKRLGSVSIATFLILRSSALVAGSFLPLAVFGAFSLATQLMQAAVTFSRLHLTATVPHLSSLASERHFEHFRSVYRSANSKSWLIYIATSQTIVWILPPLVQNINPSMPMLNQGVLLMLAGLYALEIGHGNASLALTCLNRVPFVTAAWLTGLGILVASLMVALLSPNDVVLYIVAQIICQLSYNAWKWPLTLRKHLQPES